ncbi:NnrS family protein [Paucibacter sp. DJ2R-2]|uniref:NnrS family protein n=1 Tax=Paucibacter sp. DJ2R-2 TaxID=2893558 RepID=UPI0021E37106|nr:NnrS family protein [Paucibacter sp. DJ2R-2]MCV2422191.1 NnrS family protein [Paucibacter sp. DJ4R-1]MCV2440225.1 NnrS family protein [Paucibacter sp. DJ2R-2]
MLSPHRPLFAAAAALWLSSALWWSACLLGLLPAGVLPVSVLHGWLMSLGMMPLFIAGFAGTSFPRWLDQEPLDGSRLLLPAVAAWLAWVGLLLADAAGRRGLAAGFAALPGLFMLGIAVVLLRRCARHGARFSAHAWGIAAGLLWVGLCQLCAALAVLVEQATLLQAAQRLALWLGVGSIFVLALQRLTPFVHQQGRRAPGLLIGLLLSLLLRAGLDLAALWAWPLPAPIHLSAAAVLLCLAVFVLRDAQRRELRAARRTPLVAQLHAGYMWLGLSLALDALAQGGAGLGRPDLQRALAMAALHALTLGFMGTTLLAMASRVSAVQQGRSVAVDRGLSLMQALLQLLTAGRLAATLDPVWPGLIDLLPAVALAYLVLALAWSLRYGPWLLQSGRGRGRER